MSAEISSYMGLIFALLGAAAGLKILAFMLGQIPTPLLGMGYTFEGECSWGVHFANKIGGTDK